MFATALLLFASMMVGARAACQYEIQNLKLVTCDGKPPAEWVLTDVGAEFTDECNVLLKGCAKLNMELGSMEVDYKAMKNGLEVTRGTEKVCGITLFERKFDCPMPKDMNICTDKKWVKELPKGMLSMALGNIKGQAKIKTSAGMICYNLSADIKRK